MSDKDWFWRQLKRTEEDVKQMPDWLRSSLINQPKPKPVSPAVPRDSQEPS